MPTSQAGSAAEPDASAPLAASNQAASAQATAFAAADAAADAGDSPANQAHDQHPRPTVPAHVAAEQMSLPNDTSAADAMPSTSTVPAIPFTMFGQGSDDDFFADAGASQESAPAVGSQSRHLPSPAATNIPACLQDMLPTPSQLLSQKSAPRQAAALGSKPSPLHSQPQPSLRHPIQLQQDSGSLVPVKPQDSGGLLPVKPQRTDGLLPVRPQGDLPSEPNTSSETFRTAKHPVTLPPPPAQQPPATAASQASPIAATAAIPPASTPVPEAPSATSAVAAPVTLVEATGAASASHDSTSHVQPTAVDHNATSTAFDASMDFAKEPQQASLENLIPDQSGCQEDLTPTDVGFVPIPFGGSSVNGPGFVAAAMNTSFLGSYVNVKDESGDSFFDSIGTGNLC